VDMTLRPLDEEFVIGQSLQAHELVEAYGKGRLKPEGLAPFLGNLC